MSQSIIILTHRHLPLLDAIIKLPSKWQKNIKIDNDDATHIQVSDFFLEWYFSILYYKDRDDAIEEYREDECLDGEIKNILPILDFYIIRFRATHETFKEFMVDLASTIGSDVGACWIDNSHGKVMPLTVFLQLLQNNDPGAWREEP